jgi:hypothetical protein
MEGSVWIANHQSEPKRSMSCWVATVHSGATTLLSDVSPRGDCRSFR